MRTKRDSIVMENNSFMSLTLLLYPPRIKKGHLRRLKYKTCLANYGGAQKHALGNCWAHKTEKSFSHYQT